MSALNNISTKRLVNYVSKSIQQIMESYRFEPNDHVCRDSIKSSIDTFLLHQQTQGRGLYDHKVICDNTNNSSHSIDRGNLVVDVYLKPAKAISFIHINSQMVPEPHALQRLGLKDTHHIVRWKDEL